MKSREKGLHYGIILFVLINIIIGLSGYVNAAPSKNKDPSSYVASTGGVQLDSAMNTETLENHSGGDDDEDLERAKWKALKADTEEDSEFAKRQNTESFGPPMEGGMSQMVCLVKWRNTDNLINAKHESVGWYDTVGTVISNVAILAVPSNKLRTITNSTADWYVKSVLISLHNQGTRKRLGKTDFEEYYHPRFRASRDASHRLALIILKTPLDGATGMKNAHLVANPLAPTLDDSNKDVYDDYAVTSCTMVVFTIDSASKKFSVSGIPAIATKCVWKNTDTGNAAYEDKVCVHLKIPFVPIEMLSDRMFYPNDVGAPLFCNGLLSGLYAGVQNLRGTRHGSDHLKEGTAEEVNASGKLIAPDEQYVFEVPGTGSNWKFISGFTDQTEGLKWTSTMAVQEDDKCLPPPDSGPVAPAREEEEPDAPVDAPPDDGDNEEEPPPPKQAKEGRKDKKEESAAATHGLATLAVAALVGVVVGVVV